MSDNNFRIEEISQEIPIRINNLMKYFPFFEMKRLNKLNSKYGEYDMGALTLFILSILLYKGHFKDKGLTFAEIHEGLHLYIKKSYNVEFEGEEKEEFTRYVLDKVQNEGSPFIYEYYDSVQGKKVGRNIRYIAIKRNDADDRPYYYITSDGIDFFLQTKEFGEESKITIHLMILKKLIENEDYEGALLSIVNLNTEIRKQIQKQNEILEMLMYGGNEGYRNYLTYTENAIEKLQNEKMVFEEHSRDVERLYEQYLNKIDKNILGEKETKAIRHLESIRRELGICIERHAQLLRSIVKLINEVDNIMVEKRKSKFKEKFNFNSYLDGMVNKDNASILERIIIPLLGLKPGKSFNLDKIDDMLALRTKIVDRDSSIDTGDVATNEYVDMVHLVEGRMVSNYIFYITNLLECLIETEYFDLEYFKDYLENAFGSDVITNRDFIPFFFALTEPIDKDEHFETIILDIPECRKKFKMDEIDRLLDAKRYDQIKIPHILLYVIANNKRLSIFENDTLYIKIKREQYINIKNNTNMTNVVFGKGEANAGQFKAVY